MYEINDPNQVDEHYYEDILEGTGFLEVIGLVVSYNQATNAVCYPLMLVMYEHRTSFRTTAGPTRV